MNEELEKYEEVKERLTKVFIEQTGEWFDWEELSGFEATMTKLSIGEIIRNAYAAGAEFGSASMMHNMKHDEDFGYDPASKV